MSADSASVRASQWPKVQLGDVAELCLGKMLDAAKNKGEPYFYLRNPNVRWFSVDTSNLRQMPFESHELDRYGLLAGDVLICEGGEAGRAAIWDAPLPNVKFQKAIHRVRTGPKLLNRFLVHRLKYDFDSGQLADYYTGATIKHLTGKDLARYRFSLPPMPDQRRIAAILDKADALRAKRREAIAKLDQLLQSVFLEMFGDPVTNPKGWPEGSIDIVASDRSAVRCGPFGTQLKVHELTEAGVPLWGIENVHDNRFVGSPSKFVSPEKAIQLQAFEARPGDVLITRMGTIGRACVVPSNAPTGRISYHLFRIRPDPAKCLPEFLAATISRSGTFAQQLRRLARGAIMAGLNTTVLKEVKFLLPPLELQRSYLDKVAAIDAVLSRQLQSAAQLEHQFESLQHSAFTGVARNY